MINVSLMKELLPETIRQRKAYGFSVSVRLYRELKKVKSAFRRCGAGGHGSGRYAECVRWFVENFPMLEERIRDDMHSAFGIRNLTGSLFRVTAFETLLKYYEKENVLSDENDLDVLFGILNEQTDAVIDDASSFVLMIRSAVSINLCRCFCRLFSEKMADGALLERIEKLFGAFHLLTCVKSSLGLRTNAVEKCLEDDPAGLYGRLSENTKASYRYNLCRIARKKKMSQMQLAHIIVEICRERADEAGRHIGSVLCDKPEHGKMYLVLLLFLSVLFTALLCVVSPVLFISILSVYACTKLLLDKFFVRFVKRYNLPRIELDSIPETCGVITVITTLLMDEDKNGYLFEKLEEMYFSNGGENIYFGLLCDFPDNDEKWTNKDKRIMKNISDNILMLRKKYGDIFFLFLREREYSKSDGKYMAPERKRGAVNGLVYFLNNKRDVFCEGSILPDEKTSSKIKYVFTLDSDTNLAYDCIRTMTGIMIHPCNRPVYDAELRSIVKGYGILQPIMSPTNQAAQRSFFTKVMCGYGGLDNYSKGIKDGAMALFGKSVFCGKGMFDKQAFYRVLLEENEFENGKILSHDAPEGARLRCALCDEVTLTDGFPGEELSYYKRLHRWIRGDVQNTPFLFRRVKNSEGRYVNNGIDVFSKFFIWENLFNVFFSIVSLFSLFVSAFLDETERIVLITVIMSAYFLPWVYSLLTTLRKAVLNNISSLFLSKGLYKSLLFEFLTVLFRICALPKTAFVAFDGLVRSLYRRFVSGKKMLEWTTAAQNDAEKSDGLSGYVSKNIFSAFCGTVLFVITENSFLRLLSLLWFFLPYFAYITGKQSEAKKVCLTKKQETELYEYCRDMWAFFENNVNEKTSFLPPDTLMCNDGKRILPMTSPTNIGLYLVSVVCAKKLGFISCLELEKRLDKTLSTVEKMQLSNGLLYNWYNIYTTKPMAPKFVSSVDEGNYLACLYCVLGAVKEMETEMEYPCEMAKRIKKLINRADIKSLYNESRRLFYIGYTVEDDGSKRYEKNCYDMLMSEARILSYVALAKRCVGTEHLNNLSRVFVSGRKHIGLASWSGTAFEYFMPELFFTSERGTLIYDALMYCHESNKRKAVRGVFGSVYGISESAYNEFDDGGNYKYKAHGTAYTAVCVSDEEKVVSPYSAFLFLGADVEKSLENLRTMREMGAYGKYGFYESIDFERKDKNENFGVIKSFMSHHLGMSIISSTNILLDGTIKKMFYKNPEIKAVAPLTAERIPRTVFASNHPRKKYRMKHFRRHETFSKEKTENNSFAKLWDKDSLLYVKNGTVYCEFKGYSVVKKADFGCIPSGIGIFLMINGSAWCINENSDISAENGMITISKELSEDRKVVLIMTVDKNTCKVFRLKLMLSEGFFENDDIKCVFVLQPSLDMERDKTVCRFFSDSEIVIRNETDAVTVRNSKTGLCSTIKVICGKNIIYRFNSNEQVKKSVNNGDPENLLTVQDEAFCNDGCVVCISDMKTDRNTIGCELAISVAENEKCAGVAVERAGERSIFKAAESFALRIERGSNVPAPKAEFVGVSKECDNMFSREFSAVLSERNKKLFVGKRFSFVAGCDGTEFSFLKDVNSERVTHFFGSVFDEDVSETVCFDSPHGFDLCKNASEREYLPHKAVYRGIYKNAPYTMEAYVHPSAPIKILKVMAKTPFSVFFSVLPDDRLNRNRYIGSGFCFFSSDYDEAGFVYGCKENGTGISGGADYFIEDRVVAHADVFEDEKVLFAVGVVQNTDEAYDYEKIIKSGSEYNEKIAKEFADSISVDERIVPDYIREAVSTIPSTAKGCFIKGGEYFEGINMLSLVYSSYAGKRDILLDYMRSSGMNMEAEILKCIVFCEYLRISRDMEFSDMPCFCHTVYRENLRRLFEVSQTALSKTGKSDFLRLCRVAAKGFYSLCTDISDIRTAELVKDLEKKLTK